MFLSLRWVVALPLFVSACASCRSPFQLLGATDVPCPTCPLVTTFTVVAINPSNAVATTLGTFDNVYGWAGPLTPDASQQNVWLLAETSVSGETCALSSMNLRTGATTSVSLSSCYRGCGIDGAGNVVAARWTGTQEIVVRLDPQSGGETQLGTLGDLSTWGGECRIDREKDTLYALGTTSTNVEELYALSLSNGQESEVPLSNADLALVASAKDGNPLVAFWNGSKEVVAEVDPATGVLNEKMTLADLTLWNLQTSLDLEDDLLYAVGVDSVSTLRLYRANLATGSTTFQPISTNFMLAPY